MCLGAACLARLLQVANEVNARRINDEVNIFQGIRHSPIFLAVIVITLALQVCDGCGQGRR